MKALYFEGTITSGMGKGAVFVSIDYYKDEIKKKLGFEAYPGTLNLMIDKKQTNSFKKIKPIRIEGFKKDGKTFGRVSCYKIKINGIDASIVIPELTEHNDDMMEIVAPINLKSELKVEDGDKVRVELVQ